MKTISEMIEEDDKRKAALNKLKENIEKLFDSGVIDTNRNVYIFFTQVGLSICVIALMKKRHNFSQMFPEKETISDYIVFERIITIEKKDAIELSLLESHVLQSVLDEINARVFE